MSLLKSWAARLLPVPADGALYDVTPTIAEVVVLADADRLADRVAIRERASRPPRRPAPPRWRGRTGRRRSGTARLPCCWPVSLMKSGLTPTILPSISCSRCRTFLRNSRSGVAPTTVGIVATIRSKSL